MRQLWATATLDVRGHATVTESIDYHFSKERHGIYRVLPDVPYSSEGEVRVSADTSDQTLITPEGSGIRLRIGDPDVKVSGDHHYEISYPLDTLQLHDGAFGWNGVGTSWDVAIDHAELDLVAPWTWVSPSCVSGVSGSVDPCTVTQPRPGHLVVSTGRHSPGHGVTVYAKRGAPLASTPAPRAPTLLEQTVPWWQRPVTLGVIAGVLLLAAEIVIAMLLRRRGRDWVMAGAASTGDAAGVAFESGSGPLAGAPAGAMRVDDTKLAEWATTEFAPPKGITAWQGGVLAAETPRPEHRVAWLLGTAVDGYIELDDQDPKAASIKPLSHETDATTALLAVAFDGRDEVQLGKYDRHFSSLWSSLPSMQKGWLRGSGFTDVEADERAGRSLALGVLGCVIAAPVLLIAAGTSPGRPVTALVAIVLGALLGGLSLGAVLPRLGVARAHPGGLGHLAAGRVVPALPRQLRGTPRRRGGQARSPARVHGVGGRTGRGRPLVEDGRRRSLAARHRRVALHARRPDDRPVVRLDRHRALVIGWRWGWRRWRGRRRRGWSW